MSGLSIVAGSANPALARAVAAELGVPPGQSDLDRFPDGEVRPTVRQVRGEDVYVVQPTGPPVNDNLVELLLLVDACRRCGAGRVTAVVPYFGYARQDRRSQEGQALGARVAVQAVAAAGADRLLVVDPHNVALEAMAAGPVDMVTAVPVLAAALSSAIANDGVLVAPDLGAAKLAERYAARLGRPVAVVRKSRTSATSVRAEELVGEVQGRRAVVVDDMISTGGTIEAAVRALVARGAVPEAVVATHGPLVAGAAERLAGLGVRVVVTDSTGAAPAPPALEVCSIAPLLAAAITRLHGNRSLDELLIGA